MHSWSGTLRSMLLIITVYMQSWLTYINLSSEAFAFFNLVLVLSLSIQIKEQLEENLI